MWRKGPLTVLNFCPVPLRGWLLCPGWLQCDLWSRPASGLLCPVWGGDWVCNVMSADRGSIQGLLCIRCPSESRLLKWRAEKKLLRFYCSAVWFPTVSTWILIGILFFFSFSCSRCQQWRLQPFPWRPRVCRHYSKGRTSYWEWLLSRKDLPGIQRELLCQRHKRGEVGLEQSHIYSIIYSPSTICLIQRRRASNWGWNVLAFAFKKWVHIALDQSSCWRSA